MTVVNNAALRQTVKIFGQYSQLAVRTKSPHFNYGFEGTVDVLHAAIGLTGEVRELRDALAGPDGAPDVVNALEEVGDMYWFTGVLQAVLRKAGLVQDTTDIEEADLNALPPAFMVNRLVEVLDKACHELQNHVKRTLYYVDPSEGFRSLDLVLVRELLLRKILPALSRITSGLDGTPAQVRAANLLKLGGPGGRFADKFSDVAALQRNLDQERSILEQNLGENNGN